MSSPDRPNRVRIDSISNSVSGLQPISQAQQLQSPETVKSRELSSHFSATVLAISASERVTATTKSDNIKKYAGSVAALSYPSDVPKPERGLGYPGEFFNFYAVKLIFAGNFQPSLLSIRSRGTFPARLIQGEFFLLNSPCLIKLPTPCRAGTYLHPI
jgi:hypothetical protein